MALEHFTTANFEEKVLKADQPVLLDFWSTTCVPCQMLGPTIEELASDLDGQVVVGKLDVDQEPDIAMKYGIMSIPTVVIFKDGNEVTRLVGARDKAEYLSLVR